MSDHYAHLETMCARADKLAELLDVLIPAAMAVEQAAREIGTADLGIPGELSATDYGDLVADIQRALRGLRSAERITELHRKEIKAERAKSDPDAGEDMVS